MGVPSAKIDFSNMSVKTFFAGVPHGVSSWCVVAEARGKETIGALVQMTEAEAFAMGNLSEQGKKEVRRIFVNTGLSFSLR
ncbi:MAG: hypothetical protein CMH30_07900 [Micavibrio sp.]|nr:hypothetical protein [Micavibrio sp.]|tara:strand:- start:295 stop:537 length:243 start_codon:yes stop_codon:yes gene_type:complete